MTKAQQIKQLIEQATQFAKLCSRPEWPELWAQIGYAAWMTAQGAKVTIFEIEPATTTADPETKPPVPQPSEN
jgi:hypothetical protein